MRRKMAAEWRERECKRKTGLERREVKGRMARRLKKKHEQKRGHKRQKRLTNSFSKYTCAMD